MALRKPAQSREAPSSAVGGDGGARRSSVSTSVRTSSAKSRMSSRSVATPTTATTAVTLKIEEPTDDSDYVLVGDVLVLRDPTAYRERQTRSLAALERWRVSRFLTAPRRRSWAVGTSSVPARVALAPRVNRRPRPVYEEEEEEEEEEERNDDDNSDVG